MMAGKVDDRILYNSHSMQQSSDFWFRFSNSDGFLSIYNELQSFDRTNTSQLAEIKNLYDRVGFSQKPHFKKHEISIILRNISLLSCVFKNNKYKFELDSKSKEC